MAHFDWNYCLCCPQVSPHSECVVRVTIIGDSVFKVQGVAVEPYDSAVPLTYTDELALHRG
jgi:hypothetical protein